MWFEPWASRALVKADAITGQVNRALAGRKPSKSDLASKDSIDKLLDIARQSAYRGRSLWRRPLDRWHGTSVERTFHSLHAAKIFLVDLLAPADVDNLVPTAVARVATCLPATDLRRKSFDALLTDKITPDRKRATLKQAMQTGYDASPAARPGSRVP